MVVQLNRHHLEGSKSRCLYMPADVCVRNHSSMMITSSLKTRVDRLAVITIILFK